MFLNSPVCNTDWGPCSRTPGECHVNLALSNGFSEFSPQVSCEEIGYLLEEHSLVVDQVVISDHPQLYFDHPEQKVMQSLERFP